MITHFFTVDVEEHFQVQALAPYIDRASWDSLESRVDRNTRRILDLCARHGAKGTFFTVGWVAERNPDLVRAIARGGHELASHTFDHKRIPDQTPDAFRESVRRTKSILEDLSGAPCIGFRAPSFSIVRGTEWALDILIEEGYRYDSSLFPVRRPGYGYSGGSPKPHALARPGGSLTEVPPTTIERFGMRLPAAGGAYFRLLPYGLVSTALRESGDQGIPGTFYIHPWEIDDGQPRVNVPALTKIRHYGGLARTESRLDRLLGEFSFGAIAPVLDRLAA